MRYRSKKDIGLVVPLWVALLLPLVLGVFFLIHPAPGGLWFILFLVVVVDVLILLFTYPMYYEITPPLLRVRSGVIRVKIPLNSIQQVVPDRSLGSPGGLSLAWSFDRLRVDYSNRRWPAFVYIAPRDQGKFMQDLVEQTEGLAFNDGRVIRRQ